MKVVSCYRAAQIAQVSKQLIIKRKKINADNKSKYLYFCYDPVSGKFGIDIESKLWLSYMQKRRNTAGYSVEKERLLTIGTDDNRGVVDQGNDADNDDRFNRLLSAVVVEIKNTFKPSKEKLDGLLQRISNRFEGMG